MKLAFLCANPNYPLSTGAQSASRRFLAPAVLSLQNSPWRGKKIFRAIIKVIFVMLNFSPSMCARRRKKYIFQQPSPCARVTYKTPKKGGTCWFAPNKLVSGFIISTYLIAFDHAVCFIYKLPKGVSLFVLLYSSVGFALFTFWVYVNNKLPWLLHIFQLPRTWSDCARPLLREQTTLRAADLWSKLRRKRIGDFIMERS